MLGFIAAELAVARQYLVWLIISAVIVVLVVIALIHKLKRAKLCWSTKQLTIGKYASGNVTDFNIIEICKSNGLLVCSLKGVPKKQWDKVLQFLQQGKYYWQFSRNCQN